MLIELEQGETTTLVCTITPADVEIGKIEWVKEDTGEHEIIAMTGGDEIIDGKASVSIEALIKGRTWITAIITPKQGEGDSVACEVNVVGKKVTGVELQDKNAENINLVNPTHYVPWIIKALDIAKSQGFNLPVVYNTSGYEKTETLKMLNGYVDIYLPDFKYYNSKTAKDYSNAPNYTEYAKSAISEMFCQVGKPQFYKNGIMKKGVIVRHLLLPNHLEESKQIVKYLFDTYKNDIFISIMNQYTPMSQVADHIYLKERVKKKDYNELIDFAVDIGVENGFIQEGETAKESFIPPFNCEGV